MAISFDTSGSAIVFAGLTATVSLTVAGNVLVAGTMCNSNTITGVAYNGVAMTQVGATVQNTADLYLQLWILVNPTAGVHNLVATSSGAVTALVLMGCCYAGASTTQPDSNGSIGPVSASSLSPSTTVVDTTGAWLVAIWRPGAAASAGAGTTRRVDGGGNGYMMGDSNGPVGSGAQTLTATWASPGNSTALILAITLTAGPAPVIAPQASSCQVEMALGGSYRSLCCAKEPTAWYRFAETNDDTTVRDYSDSGGYHGTAAGTITIEQDPGVPDGGYAYRFDGVDDRVTFTTLPATGTTVTIEAVIKPNTPSAAGVILSDTTGTVYFGLDSARKLNMFFTAASHLSTGALTDLAWSHVMVVITAGSGTFYINGAASGTFTLFPGFTPTRIGRYDTALPLKAYLDELLIYPQALTASDASAHYLATLWTDVSADVSGDKMTMHWGITGSGPTDRIASPGLCQFALLNQNNAAHLLGYYSPLNSNCRTGFTHGVLTRVSFVFNSTTYRRFYGKIISIDPTPGRYRERQTKVIIGDLQHDIVNTELRNVTLQVTKTEAELQKTLLLALPPTAQPVAIDLDTGLDTSPYAFDTLGAGVAAIRPIGDLINSVIGFEYISPTGVYRYENRQTRQLKTTSVSFSDNMVDLTMPSSLDLAFNHIRATFHPKTIDAAATTVLWLQTGTPPSVAAAETIVIWGDYYKAGDQKVKIGGTAQVNPVATTDYLANTLADGSGTNKTANVTVTATYFASSVKFTITNNDAAAVFITFLQCRGKGLYDYSPVTVESLSTQPYGDRPINIDMPYQASYNTAKGLADYLLAQFESLTNQAQEIVFSPQRSSTFMSAALTVQIGDRVSIMETVTGANSDVFVQGIELTSEPTRRGPRLTCKLRLASATYFDSVWLLEDAVYGLLDTTTILGFA